MQSFILNLVPGLFQQVFNCSQGDIGRQLTAKLVDGSTEYEIPAGSTVKIKATKPSGFGFDESVTFSGSTVTITTAETMTNEWGRFPAELVITKDGNVIGTANFLFNIEKNPHPDSTVDGDAEEVIPELTLLVERVEAAASSVLDMEVVATTLPAGSQASYSYDEDLNKATFGIPQGEAGAGAAGVVASAYSSSKTYKVGDYVLHNSNLYRCITAITTAEAFTAAHWTQIVLADDVSDLKTDLSHTEVQFPLINGVILPPPFEIGTRYVNNGQEAYNTQTQRMSIKRGNYVQLKKGDIVSIDRNVLRYFGGGYSTDGGSTFIGIGTRDTPYIAPADGIYFFWLYKIGEAVFTEGDVAKGWTYISFKRPDSLVEQLDPVIINALKAPNLPYPEHAWIRYSNGEKVSSNATKLYVFKSNLPKYIKAFLTSETNALCAIAFYTSDDVSTDGYMQDKSVDFESGTHNDGLWYATEVPSGCKTIAITTKEPSESVADPIILFDGLSVTEANLNEKDYADYPLNKDYYNGWIRHGTGELVASNATKCYPIINNGITKVRVFTKSDTNIIDCVSFYSGNTISTDTYLQTSVSWKGVVPNGDWYDVDVPNGVGLIAITVSNASGAYRPKILISVNDLIKVTDNRYALLSQVQKSLDERNDDILNGDWRYIYHFGMGAVADRSVMPTIPSQSVFDIRNAHNLGYKCIEANVHKTSDNKYVVTHGQNGALGHDFDTLGGEDAYGVVISENTLQTLKDNYRYRSSIEEYRTSITTLEEFCHEAKRLNMIVMFQYKDPTELAIIKGIMGKRFFMYVAPRSEYKGVISEYYSYTTKAEILARCNTVGKPYIYSMGNPTSFSDSDLQDIINTLHENGYYLASAYVGRETIKKLTSMGFDFIVVTDGADVTNEVILDGKKLSFNIDGSVTWEEAPLD